jgi:hypothetical protein
MRVIVNGFVMRSAQRIVGMVAQKANRTLPKAMEENATEIETNQIGKKNISNRILKSNINTIIIF